jgi:hypothetical protein
MENKSKILGRALKDSVKEVWKKSGQHQALQLISKTNISEIQVRVRWVWLDDKSSEKYKPNLDYYQQLWIKQGKELSYKTRSIFTTGYLYTYIPVSIYNQFDGALELSEPLIKQKTVPLNSIQIIVILLMVTLLVFRLL